MITLFLHVARRWRIKIIRSSYAAVEAKWRNLPTQSRGKLARHRGARARELNDTLKRARLRAPAPWYRGDLKYGKSFCLIKIAGYKLLLVRRVLAINRPMSDSRRRYREPPTW